MFRSIIFFISIVLLLAACGGRETISQTTPSPTNTVQPTATSTSTPTATPTSSPTPTLTATPTDTPSPTNTLTPTPTKTPTSTPTPVPTDTATPVPPTAVPTQAPTVTPVPQSSSPCPISGDSSYGYSAENPIRVGGDAFGGPPRARAYLDTLRGPGGQAISYSRTGSIFSETLGTVLDIYSLTYDGPGSPVSLYIDQYSYTTLMAPAGLTCASAFPLSAP